MATFTFTLHLTSEVVAESQAHAEHLINAQLDLWDAAPSLFSWPKVDWELEEVEEELGECDECGETYELSSRIGRCGDCGYCADHCEHGKPMLDDLVRMMEESE